MHCNSYYVLLALPHVLRYHMVFFLLPLHYTCWMCLCLIYLTAAHFCKVSTGPLKELMRQRITHIFHTILETHIMLMCFNTRFWKHVFNIFFTINEFPSSSRHILEFNISESANNIIEKFSHFHLFLFC
jgi:hypothetical protein